MSGIIDISPQPVDGRPGIFQLPAPKGMVRYSAQDAEGNELASLAVTDWLFRPAHLDILQQVIDRLGAPKAARGDRPSGPRLVTD